MGFLRLTFNRREDEWNDDSIHNEFNFLFFLRIWKIDIRERVQFVQGNK